jgi:hypothetical protein
MGKVALKKGIGEWYFDGDIITKIAYGLYCDKCGSFDVMNRSIFKWREIIAFTCFLIGLFGMFSHNPCLIMLFFILAIIFHSLQRHIYSVNPFENRAYICRKCKNIRFTGANSLNYPEYDERVLDISYEDVIKYYIDNDMVYPLHGYKD